MQKLYRRYCEVNGEEPRLVRSKRKNDEVTFVLDLDVDQPLDMEGEW